MRGVSPTGIGVIVSILASVLFGALFYLAGIASSSGTSLFAWRAVALPVLYAPLLVRPRVRTSIGEFFHHITRRWWMPVVFVVLATTISFAAWLFMWAPRNGYGLDSSLGFLLLPIAIVVVSRTVLGSYVSRAQWVVVGLATIAVGVKIFATPELGWVTIAVVGTLTVYFIARSYLGVTSLTAYAMESTAALPVAVVFLFHNTDWAQELGLVIAVGVVSVAAMSAYVAASTLLPLPLFGLLSYVEPVLLVIVSLILGETMHSGDVFVYGILAVALALLGFTTSRDIRKLPHANDPTQARS